MTAPSKVGEFVPYPKRWAGFDPAKKLALVGDPKMVAAFDGLLDLDEEGRARALGAAAERMRTVVAKYRSAQSQLEALKTERDRLMIEQALLGAQQAGLARDAGVFPQIVGWALYGRESTREGRKRTERAG